METNKMKKMNGKNRKTTILLVEDEEEHRILIKQSLRECHVLNEMYCVESGEEAMDYLSHRNKYVQKSPKPGLILLDLSLPKMGGLDLLKIIKESEELMDIPTVILTSSGREIDIAKAYMCHANSYIVKPVDFNKFAETVKEVGLYWLICNTASEERIR